MQPVQTLRYEIEKCLTASGYTLSRFAQLSGINRGILSGILHSNKPISIRILDLIAHAFGYPEGWNYELYEDECFIGDKVSRPRIESFMIRCAEVGKMHCIRPVVSRLLDNPKHTVILFSIAEKIHQAGLAPEAVRFYELVADSERDSHSERLALSHYRLFKASQNAEPDERWRAAVRFHPFRRRLPEPMQLDALLQLSNLCYLLQKWDEVGQYADELFELATAIYRDQTRPNRRQRDKDQLQLERPLVVYHGQGLLMKGVALQKQRKYEAAKRFVLQYEDLSWYKPLDERQDAEIEKFRIWSKGNMFKLELLLGNRQVLPRYVQYLSELPNEMLTGMLTIMESANEYDYEVEEVLTAFTPYIHKWNTVSAAINKTVYFHFCYQWAVYDFRRRNYERGMDQLLLGLSLANSLNNHEGANHCIRLFWKYRFHAMERQQQGFSIILEKEGREHEQMVNFAGSYRGRA